MQKHHRYAVRIPTGPNHQNPSARQLDQAIPHLIHHNPTIAPDAIASAYGDGYGV